MTEEPVYNISQYISGQDLCRMGFIANKLYGIKNRRQLADDAGDHCPLYFDGVLCWRESPANYTATLPCPPSIEGHPYVRLSNVTRLCQTSAEWAERADYGGCVAATANPLDMPVAHLRVMFYLYWIGYLVSLFFLLFALSIFLHYKNLWCLRNIIHTNLTLCFTLHNITWILYSLVGHQVAALHPNGSFCLIPTTLLKYFIAAGFFWMFVEGVYLFINVLFSFYVQAIHFWHCAVVGWGIPFVLVFATSVLRRTGLSQHCWDEEQHYLDYIFIGPILLLLFVNMLFLLSIMYVIMARLTLTVSEDAARYKKGTKALLILCPLLGINYIFVLAQPSKPLWLKLLFSYYGTIVSASQGVLVALLFCFRNAEVREFTARSAATARRKLAAAAAASSSASTTLSTRNSHSDFHASVEQPAERPLSHAKCSTVSVPAVGSGRSTRAGYPRNVIMMNADGRLCAASRQTSVFRSHPQLLKKPPHRRPPRRPLVVAHTSDPECHTATAL